ncbi:MAG: hypothetical protein GEV08_05270 [Acidimicrobiia bacterium]|nr:hypothetical protein [Acidimicrobiia bacterium]
MGAPIHTHQDSIEISAPPEVVYDLVTAMERYGEWSSENTGGYWRKGADGVPGTGKVGDMFVGVNQRAGREWKAPVEIVEREPGRSFAFVTGGLEYDIALWKYDVASTPAGTRLTESYELHNLSPQLVEGGDAAFEDRMDAMRTSIRATLEGMKASAEQAR